LFLSDLEISGFGQVEEIRPGVYLVVDILVLDQEVSAAETVLDGTSVAMLMSQVDDPNSLKLWWHSHHRMDAFWSGTDEATIRELAQQNFIFSLVGRQNGEVLVRLDIPNPAITIDGLSVEILRNESVLLDECREEMAAKVRRRFVHPPVVVLTGNQQEWGSHIFGAQEGDMEGD
jgi:hypothetical protein